MKFADVVQVEPELLSPPEAAKFVGRESVLNDLVKYDWVKPTIQKARSCTLYRISRLRACVDFMERTGTYPSPETKGMVLPRES